MCLWRRRRFAIAPNAIASHGAAARKQGMTEAQYSELLAIVGLANETNRLVTALDVAVDPQFR